jgi:hypothetical protein
MMDGRMEGTDLIAIGKGVKAAHEYRHELFEDGQKFVAIEVSHNQEEKMAVADSGGCAQGKNRPLLPPLEGYRIIWDIRPPLRKRPPLI